MGLRAQAAADLQAILEDTADFGWPISVTDPNGITQSLTGSSTDIGESIDPETGVAVVGRRASVALVIASLVAAGFTELPRAISDPSSAPWVVVFDDVGGSSHTYRVVESMPDRALGVVVCVLEAYQP